MLDSHLSTTRFRKAQNLELEPISSPTAFPYEIDPGHCFSESTLRHSPLKRSDSGFFEGTCQVEEKSNLLACVKDNKSHKPRASTPKSHPGQSPIPQRLREVIRQDLWNPNTVCTVHHGYRHPDVSNDKRIAALCSLAANSSQNVEVVKFTRAISGSGDEAPMFETRPLYGPGAPNVEARLQKWAAARAIAQRKQSRTNVATMKKKQCRADGGLLASLQGRINRRPGRTGIVHCQVNKPLRSEKMLLSSYEDAFKGWDVAMSKSIPGYADNYKKRHWYISQWDKPSPK
ncbi:hypothetical protein AYO20_10660 [Fonsecaea nubica]|uniref:Uncharacterized protein n=1 Tax=Fonsecaea nubica TaxID=856822 RepID=A0A178C4P7_9EURO|nr:hypothetical protein AYO20_10660 [Fonsecaea nubica]OAL24434.1 hypothetical protein AYO20_10660 [Fonsecaea nubica]